MKECLCGGASSKCLFHGRLESEQHQDGARLGDCLLFSFFFLISSSSSLPPFSSTSTPHSSAQTQTLHARFQGRLSWQSFLRKNKLLLIYIFPHDFIQWSFGFDQHRFSRVTRPEPGFYLFCRHCVCGGAGRSCNFVMSFCVFQISHVSPSLFYM